MWLFSLFLIKIAPVWYHTITTVSDTQIMRNLNEIMAKVRLQSHLSEFRQGIIEEFTALAYSRKQGVITNAVFQQQKQELFNRMFRGFNAVYKQAYYDAFRLLSIKEGSLDRKVNTFYHWSELNRIRRSKERLYPFVVAIGRKGSGALVDSGDIARILDIRDRLFPTANSLDNIVGPVSTDNLDLSNISLFELSEVYSPGISDFVFVVNEAISMVPYLI